MSNSFVYNAINNLKVVDSDYYESTLRQRFSNGAGSVIDRINTIDDMEKLLLNSEWHPYEHPSIMKGCKGFRTDIAGHLGIIDLNDIPDDLEGVLDDRKYTGKASVCLSGIRRIPVDFTVLITGTEIVNGEDKDVMFTFHPGPPISPSILDSRITYYFGFPISLRDGKRISVKKAKELGLKYGKII